MKHEQQQEPTRKEECPCRYCTEHRPACHDEKVCDQWATWKPGQEKRAAEILQEKQLESYYSQIGKKKTKRQRPAKQLHTAGKQEERRHE